METTKTFDSERYVSAMKEISDSLYAAKAGSHLRELIEKIDRIDGKTLQWEDMERARRMQRDMEEAKRCYRRIQELLESYF